MKLNKGEIHIAKKNKVRINEDITAEKVRLISENGEQKGILTIEDALETLKKAHESKDIELIKTELEKINEAWKNASEEMYKAQAENPEAQADEKSSSGGDKKSEGDDVQDVDFEEVKE